MDGSRLGWLTTPKSGTRCRGAVHPNKLDDPSFNAPIYANLFDDEDGDGHTLIWSRARRQNGD
jgi:uncharacterized protein (DUF736 family)